MRSLTVGALAMVSFASVAFAEVELDGYCPVCYVAAGKAVLGTKDYKVEYNGDTYYFVNKKAMGAFEATPEKFIPAFDGLCAYGISIGKELEADPTQFSVVDGKIYLSSSTSVKELFDADAEGIIKTANAKWEMMTK